MKIEILSASKQIVCYDANGVNEGLLRVSNQRGNYLLKNGAISQNTVFDQEYGIFIDENLYIPLKISKEKLTAREAKLYYDMAQWPMPDLYKIIRFQQAVVAINYSLKRIGMQSSCFPENVLDSLWYDECLSSASGYEKRRCVLICEYNGYVRPNYETYKDYILYDNKFLYHKEQSKYVLAPLTLKLSVSGIDILNNQNMVLVRDKNMKLKYLLENADIKVCSEELLLLGNILYQIHNQELIKISVLSKKNQVYVFNGNQIKTLEYVEHTQSGVLIASDEITTYYNKDKNGLFRISSRDTKNIYK